MNTSFENYPKIIKKLGLNHSEELSAEPEKCCKPLFYTIKTGDNLWSISENFLGSGQRYEEIMALNGLDDENIYPGQIIRIPQNINSGYLLYRVKSGNTLWEISQKFLGNGSKYTEIMNLNGLTNDMIYPGQILKIPVKIKSEAMTYTVKPGDTLWSISQRFLGSGSKYVKIMTLNGLTSDRIKAGQELTIPLK